LNKGGLVVVSGPAGVGKTTVVAKILETPGLTRSVSATTRAPRGAEQHGKDYWFTSREQFERGIAQGEYLEHAAIHGNLYGTPLRPLEEAVAAGKVVVLAIDVQGAAALRAMKKPFVGVFLMPPSVDELKHRLAGRGDTPPEERERRLKHAIAEMEQRHLYDAVVVNETVGKSAAEILRILRERQLL